MSAWKVSGSPATCSGAMKGSVPTTFPLSVSVTSCAHQRTMPKSRRWMRSSSSTNTFVGLRSRWMSPCRWIAASVSNNRGAMRVATLHRSAKSPESWIRVRMSTPLTASIAYQRTLSVCPAWDTRTTPGMAMLRRLSNSRRNRRSSSSSPRMRTLSATSPLGLVRRALYTTAEDPRPSSSRITCAPR